MRILHTSDWHLGRTFHGRVLDAAHAAFADHLVELVDSEGVDAVVISGDVYDRAIPPVESVRLLDDVLRRLSDRTRVVVTPGNHDSARRLGFGSSLFRESLVVRPSVSAASQPVIIPDRDGRDGLYIYPLPYLDPDAARFALPPLLEGQLGEAVSEHEGEVAALGRSHEAVVSGALRLVAADLKRRRAGTRDRTPALVMAHAFIVGGQASVDSERDIRVGGVDSVPAGVFSTLGGSADAAGSGGLDYVALGHLHRPQEIRTQASKASASDDADTSVPSEAGAAGALPGPRLVYSGSPLPFSFSEAQWAKSSVIVDFEPGHGAQIERIPVPFTQRIETVEGTVEQLLSPAYDGMEDAWVRAIVHGSLPAGGLAPLRDKFPHLLALVRRNVVAEQATRTAVTSQTDPLSVCRDFLESVTGTDATESHLAAFSSAYEAVLADRRSA